VERLVDVERRGEGAGTPVRGLEQIDPTSELVA